MSSTSNRVASDQSGPKRPLIDDVYMSDQVNIDLSDLQDTRKRAKEALDYQGVPPEMVATLETQMGKLDLAVSTTLSKYKPQGTESKPWASEWKTERLWIAAPVSGISVENSLIDQVILYTVRKAPTRVTIVPGAGAEDIPSLSVEDERFLSGLLLAIESRRAPNTLKCGSSSIIDLTFYACWNLASARLVHDKEKRGIIHPSVLPEGPVKGGKASEYLSKRFSALRATLGLNHSHIADTIERVIKIWSEQASELCKEVLLRTKIPWGIVLSKGGEHKVKRERKRGVDVIQRLLTTPINPKESAWVLPFERKFISHLSSPVWGRLDKYQQEWVALKGEDTHSLFDSFVRKIQLAYKEMHRLSDATSKKLGQRKAVILNVPEIKGMTKKDLKNLKTNDMVLKFSKLDMAKLPDGAKAMFEPIHVAASYPAADELLIVGNGRSYTDFFSNKPEGLDSWSPGAQALYYWEKEWFRRFRPTKVYTPQDIPRDVVETSNMFESLIPEE